MGGNGDNGDRVVVTHGGCSLANGGESSSFAAFLVGALALLRIGRRRAR
jgi:MYXO-CTERM domain-containing protein